jgi:thiol:disulfide interchange protein DsbA
MKTAVLLLVFVAAAFVIPPAAGAEDPFLPSFGEGKVKVRLYTDYFCPPCRAMEPDIEPIATELVKDGIVTLTFVDTPFFTYSSLYARYFLYSIYARKDVEYALRVRRFLIEAAKNGLNSADRLEAYLKEKGVTLKPFDPGSTFKVFSRHLKEDAVEATPSCVIETNGERKKYNGGGNIIEALKKLKKKQPGK